ncbi:MAG: flagellar basal body-associated FliL family protein [Rhizomicrobium sp.]
MAKKDKQAEADDADGKDGAPEGDAPSRGFVKKLLGNKLILFGGAGLALLLALGGGAYFFFFAGADTPDPKVAAADVLPPTPPNVTFYDVPDIIVNIQGADATPAYLKLSVSLELDSIEEEAGIKALMPRVVDQFQGYLRELRMDDLKGSAGVVRLKEELLRRINASAAPYRVRDVLLKQMIVQ